jgi:ribosomal protein L30/L7E
MPGSTPPPPIRSLFVTLRRGLAGVRESHRAVVTDGMGLRKRERTVRISNNASNRGMIDKVRTRSLRSTTEREKGRRRPETSFFFNAPPRYQKPKKNSHQVRHLLSVETDEQRRARRAAEAARSAQREPLELEH